MLILSLPPEIIDQIIFLVEKPRDLLALALACRAVSEVIIPYHIDYRHILTPLRSNLWDHLITRRDLANRISHLYIHDDAESYGTLPFPRLVDWSEGWANETTNDTLLRVCDALSSMKNLVSLKWKPLLSELDPETTVLEGSLWPTIQSFASLRHLHLPYPMPRVRKYNVLSNPVSNLSTTYSTIFNPSSSGRFRT